MKHITNVLVYSNRCEVLDSHIFTVGDKGFPHIRLKFIYMFGADTLQGKELELKYILPDKTYSTEKIVISDVDGVIFPIHYSVFVNGGWSTLKISLIEGTNRITLDDIIIKTKKLDAGDKFQHKDVKAIVEAEITNIKSEAAEKIEEINRTAETQKEEINQAKVRALQEIESKKASLKGDKGDTGPQGSPGKEIKNLSYTDNKLKLTMSDESSKEVEIRSGLRLRQVFKGSMSSNSNKIHLGDKWQFLCATFTGNSRGIEIVIRNYLNPMPEGGNRLITRSTGPNDDDAYIGIINNFFVFSGHAIQLREIFVLEEVVIDESNPGEILPEDPK